MSMREDLYRAAITCRHEITHDQIILYVDHRKEGNALSQLADRLEKSALASQAQQTCTACKGSGYGQPSTDSFLCPTCNGTGCEPAPEGK